MTNDHYTTELLSPTEVTLISDARSKRPQGYACDDGIVRCRSCVQTLIVKGDTSILPIEPFTPIIHDGDDWCSDCDRDIRTQSPTPLVSGR